MKKKEIERLLLAHSPQLRAILEESRRQIREGEWLSEEEFWSQVRKKTPSKKNTKRKRKGA